MDLHILKSVERKNNPNSTTGVSRKCGTCYDKGGRADSSMWSRGQLGTAAELEAAREYDDYSSRTATPLQKT